MPDESPSIMKGYEQGLHHRNQAAQCIRSWQKIVSRCREQATWPDRLDAYTGPDPISTPQHAMRAGKTHVASWAASVAGSRRCWRARIERCRGMALYLRTRRLRRRRSPACGGGSPVVWWRPISGFWFWCFALRTTSTSYTSGNEFTAHKSHKGQEMD